MPKLILKVCTQCGCGKARNSNFTFHKDAGYVDICRTCNATDPRKKTCSKCGEEKSYRNFYANGKGGVFSECIICYNKRKKPKAAPVAVAVATNNPFEWRTFVQPTTTKGHDPYSQSN